MKKGGIIVGTLVLVIIAVVFVIFASKLLFDFFSNIPSVTGAIGDSTDVICFGEGETVHCLTKANGTELFSFEAASAWTTTYANFVDPLHPTSNLAGADESIAQVTPVLTEDNEIYFATGNHFMAYTAEGRKKWPYIEFESAILSDITVDETYIGFVKIETELVLLHKETGTVVAKLKEDDSGKVPIYYTPILEEPYLFYTLINLNELESGKSGIQRKEAIRKYNFKNTADTATWKIDETNAVISADLSASDKYICYPVKRSDGLYIICADKENGEETFSAKASDANKASKITFEDDVIYFGLGNTVQKWNISSGQTKWSTNAVFTGAFTGIAVGADLACFGESERVVCLNSTTGKIEFTVNAPLKWDEHTAISKPAILEETVFIGLGDHLCSFNSTTKGTFTGDVKYENDLIVERANWCIDYNERIETDIAGLPANEDEK